MPGIKHIVAQVGGGAHDAAVLQLSAALAARFGAGLEAVFAETPPFLRLHRRHDHARDIEAQQRLARERVEAAKKALAQTEMPSGVATWTLVAGRVSDAMIARARYADLAVVPQPGPDERDAATDYDFPAEIVMGLGRPVLMVPYAGKYPDAGKRNLAAWSGTRKSARAFTDALPFSPAPAR